ncbi:MAG: CHAT domain-containing protein [Acidobacteriota bacterium]
MLGICLVFLACQPAPDLDLPVVIRNHQEVVVLSNAELLPLFLLPESRPSLCLQPAATADTSRWEMRLSFAGMPLNQDFRPPVARMATVLCFEGQLPSVLLSGREGDLCGELIDRFDGSRYRTPCRRIGFRPALPYAEFRRDRAALLRSASAIGLDRFLERWDALNRQNRQSFPLAAVQLDLVAVHFLREAGSRESQVEARRRLRALPAWLEQSEASGIAAEALREQALLELVFGNPAAAWGLLSRAERSATRVAYRKRFMITVSQAELLARQGAVDEAIDRLRAALDDCRFAPCDDALLPSAYGQLAWLMQFQQRISDDELAAAESVVRQALERLPGHAPLERVNQMLNLALLRVRRGLDPGAELERARALLGEMVDEGEMHRRRRAWIELVAGLAAFGNSRFEAARQACAELEPGSDLRLAAWAASCGARARRALGDLRGADELFERALGLHEVTTWQRRGGGLPVGFGPQSEDFARAARVAVELDRPDVGWQRLARLDRMSTLGWARQRCRERAADDQSRSRWSRLDRQAERLLAELAALEVPASRARSDEIRRTRRSLVDELRQLWRRWPACEDPGSVADLQGAAYRAVALEDEVLLLRRQGSGEYSLARRTSLRRQALQRALDRLAQPAVGRSEEAWRRTLEPIAQAFAPEGPPDPVTRYALHGLLQRVPLGALPLSEEWGAGEARWLGEVTTPVVVPAGADRPRRRFAHLAPPLFLVDPGGDLAAAVELLPLYRRLFPRAEILSGAQVTGSRAREGLKVARELIHVDSHGRYQPGFPEISALLLADDEVTLAVGPVWSGGTRLVNLSGCHTGRWPVSPDSGRFGLGGLLAQLGVPWVVASRGELGDRLAGEFNRAFYREIAAGQPVPVAFGKGLAEVRRRFSAAEWSGLMLISGAVEPSASGAG